MSKEIDEIKEKIARKSASFGYDYCDIAKRMDAKGDFTEALNAEGKFAEEILKVETPTHRIAIVKKKPELPLIQIDTADEAGIVRRTKKALLDAGFVQEEKPDC